MAIVGLLVCVFVPRQVMAQLRDDVMVEWVAANQGYTNQHVITNVNIDPYIRAEFSKGSGSMNPAYYTANLAVRWYYKNTIKVAPNGDARIFRIEYWAKYGSGSNTASEISETNGTYTDVKPTSSTTAVASVWESTEGLTDNKGVTIMLNGTGGHRRVTKIVVVYSLGSTGQLYTLTYNVNDGTSEPATVTEQYVDGSVATVKPFSAFSSFSAPDNCIFDSWNTTPSGESGITYIPGATILMQSDKTLFARWIDITNGLTNYIMPTTVNPQFPPASNGYTDWDLSFEQAQKKWQYKGNSYRQDNYLQLRGLTSSGIVTYNTVHVGTVARVEVTWNGNTTDGRVLQVYGKNTPYSSPSDLYSANQGALLGTIEKGIGQSTVLNINGSYSYIGVRVATGTAYFDDIRFVWNDETASTEPSIEFAPLSLAIGNVAKDEEVSRDFIVSQSNIENGTVSLTVSHGLLSCGTTTGQTISIGNAFEPQTITWTFTPTVAGVLGETVTAQWYDEASQPQFDTPIQMDITGYVFDGAAPTTLSVAKSSFVNQGITEACINLTGVEVIGHSDQYLFLQDDDAGLLVYGFLPESLGELTTGCKFTGGVLLGSFVKFQNTVVELQNFEFYNATFQTDQPLTAVTVLPSQLLNDTYQHRYVKMTNVSLQDWKLKEISTYDLYIDDMLSPGITMRTAPETTQNLTIQGLLNYTYSSTNSAGVYELVPTSISDIHADASAAMPYIGPTGGTSSNPVHCLTVTMNPVANTTLWYEINDNRETRYETNESVTINITGLTHIQAYASRDFYNNSDEVNYYYDIPDNVKTVYFDINGTRQNIYVVQGGHLTAAQIPTVPHIEDFTLAGWSLWSNGPSTELVDPTSITINNNITLHAVYAKASHFEFQQVTEMSSMEKGAYIIMGYDGSKNYLLRNVHVAGNPVAYDLSLMNLKYENRKIMPVAGGYLSEEVVSQLSFDFTPLDDDIWTVRSSANNNYSLASTGNNTNVHIGIYNEAHWRVQKDQLITERINVQSYNSQRYLTLYGNQDWRAYASALGTTNSHPELFIFKKTPVFTVGDTKYNRIFCDETATSNIDLANVGKAIIPSGHYLKMDGYVLQNTDATQLVIEDGATFVPAIGSTQPKATVTKHINKYTSTGRASILPNGWVLLGSPVGLVNANGLTQIDGSQVLGLATGNYDIYTFDAAQELEWRNYKANQCSMPFGDGPALLYGNAADVDITFVGNLATQFDGQPLSYEGNGDLKGWNLIGNPFVCEATLSRDYLRLNDHGSELIVGDGLVRPMEGVFVQATTTGETYNFVPDGATMSRGLISVELMDSNGDAKDSKLLDRAMVRFGEGATLGKMMLNSANTKLYLQDNDNDYAVVYSKSKGEASVCFEAATNGTYTLTVTPHYVEMNYLHLIDNITGANVDLLQTPVYTFEAKTTDNAQRFRLEFEARDIDDSER